MLNVFLGIGDFFDARVVGVDKEADGWSHLTIEVYFARVTGILAKIRDDIVVS